MKKPKPKSKIRFPELSRDDARSLSSVLTALTALWAVTCAGAVPPPEAQQPAGGRETEQAPPPGEPDPAVQVVSPPVAGSVDRGAPAEDATRLGRFVAALRGLERKERGEPVRVLWFGDSHTAADFWPNTVREALQSRFGNGGPGYVYLGLKVYRHSGVLLERKGRFRQVPRAPSFWERQDDGVFGLGGIRMVPESPESSVTVTLAKGAVTGRARWEMAYRLKRPDASFVVRTGGESRTLNRDTSPADASGVARYAFETAPDAKVEITRAVGAPEFLGATIESSEPGVVIDTLGINGARIATPLAWDEAAFVEDVRRRNPSLVVLAYGTNEVGDALAPSRYAKDYDEMLRRLRAAAPAADCMIIGPTDRAGPDWTTNPRVFEIEAVEREAASRLGCAFVSAVELMGGAGSLKQWAERSPPLASADRVHLTVAGYRELGRSLAKTVLDAYGPP